jgi:hypothetical protein
MSRKPVNSAREVALYAPVGQIAKSILFLRCQKVLLDSDLAILYGVPTKVLVQAVMRNRERFPEDFMIQLTAAAQALRITEPR